MPEGHRIRELLNNAGTRLREPDPRPVVTFDSGWLEVDGVFAKEAPGNRAVVLQRLDAQGQVVETRYVAAGSTGLQRTSTGPIPERITASTIRLIAARKAPPDPCFRADAGTPTRM